MTRRDPLEDLVHWRGEPDALVRAIRRSGAKGPVVLTRDHAAAAVAKVADGLARPEELVDWAHAVHFEDELDIEEGHEDLLTQFLFEVSTPELFEPIDRQVCQRWLSVLRASPASGAEAPER
ncbi:hypothetical protein [Streptomyces cucumeris]|uniref:hypothetical protein n=1 Tax=Streptomyces cucumeris TaxID=2962890 RepID=UPI003D721692